jgi:hypothetical protein
MLSLEASELMGSSSAVGGGGATAAVFLDRFFVPPRLPAPPLLVRFVAAFFVPFFAAFLPPPFFVDFLAAFLVDFFVPPLDLDFDAPFFAALPPPLRAPLDFLLPFLAAIAFAPLFVLSLVQRNKIINYCPRSFFTQTRKDRKVFLWSCLCTLRL